MQGSAPKILWSIAGFDPSSGAGITADLMTFAAHGHFGCAAITALTVQNTVGVSSWQAVESPLLQQTLERLQEDLPPAGVKIGMLGQAVAASVVSAHLRAASGAAARPVVVLDPVLRSSSGRVLFPDEGFPILRDELLPQVDWVTPNWAELEVLAEQPVRTVTEARQAARVLTSRYAGLHVVATGGDQDKPIDLLVLSDGAVVEIPGTRVQTTSTHGTGCAFSSALLSSLVLGMEPVEAVRAAKAFVEGALRNAPGLGRGRGPMGLLWPLQRHVNRD